MHKKQIEMTMFKPFKDIDFNNFLFSITYVYIFP